MRFFYKIMFQSLSSALANCWRCFWFLSAFPALLFGLIIIDEQALSLPFTTAFWRAGTLPTQTCGDTGDGCYNDTLAKAVGAVVTSTGKQIQYVNGIWVENGGTRVLASDGSDSWAYQLTPDGRNYNTNLLNKANIAGRVCPTHVFVPGVLTKTSQCLYYGSASAAQRLDATANDSATDQTTVGSIRLGSSNTAASGNGIGMSWYEGNIQTCAAKGMRLPTLYEVAGGSSGNPSDAIPSPIFGGTRVPAASWIWTATANDSSGYYENSNGASQTHTLWSGSVSVICVSPGQSAPYTVSYNANGGSGSVPTDSNQYATGNAVTVAAQGALTNGGSTFLGWNTAAGGSGTNYVAGSGSFAVASANVILYAQWGAAPTCGGVGDSCYNSSAALAAGAATTPGGKSLTLSSGVWVESGAGTHVLASDGLDNWAYQLRPDGRNYSSNSLDKANVAGRVCPTHVFVPGVLTKTSQCLYYGSASAGQRLDATNNDNVTDQTTVGSIRLGSGSTAASGGSYGLSWYEGNIQTCAAKGMRLPTIYEAAGGSGGSPSDASPTPSYGGTRVPAGSWTWTATANDTTGYYEVWNGASQNHGLWNGGANVICVSPGQTAPYTVSYDVNGGSGTAPTDSNQYATGNVVTVAAQGALTKDGSSFLGWNTAANGSGTNYVAGYGTFTVASANVTLYAQWGTAPTCGGAGDSCYNSSAALAAGMATTPGGKALQLINGVWVEYSVGTRVLASDGFDNWAYQLTPDGRNYGTNTLDKANVAGRVCPTHVFVPGVLTKTSQCLYYGAVKTGQRLDATANDSVTDQTTAGSIRLASWSNSASGNGTSASWYEGNIQTCAVSGMRLPTIYEVAAGSSGAGTDANPSPSYGGTRVPASGYAWTATANGNAGYYEVWNGASQNHGLWNGSANVICVTPGQTAPYTVTYDANGGSGTPPTDSNQYATGNVVTVKSMGSPSLIKNGFSFMGWNTAADGSGSNYVAAYGSFAMGSANITLYANWGSGPQFPSDISGMILWFDATDTNLLYQDSAKTTQVAANNDPVGAWTAKVGLGTFSVLQATAGKRPIYLTNAQNGRPVVRFNGTTGTYLESAATINMSTPNTIIVVAKDNGTSQIFGGVFSHELYMSVFSGGSYYWLDTSGGNVAACTVPAINVFRVITAQYTQASTVNSNVFYNGTLYSSCSNGSGNTSAGLGRVELGGRAWGGYTGRIFKGDIAEVIVYNRVIDDGERAQVEAYLTTKWGL